MKKKILVALMLVGGFCACGMLDQDTLETEKQRAIQTEQAMEALKATTVLASTTETETKTTDTTDDMVDMSKVVSFIANENSLYLTFSDGTGYYLEVPEIETETTEQRYIARYGTTKDFGATIATDDGNIWTLKDAPEFENGTQVRVLFDSNGTYTPKDDIILDVTEK